MSDLARRALANVLTVNLAVAVLIFLPAWSLAYWQGWLYWLVTLAGTLGTTFYFSKYRPALIARRLKSGPLAEKEPRQKLIQSLNSAAILVTFIVSGLDHAFGWSRVPAGASIAAAGFIAIGYALVFRVFLENGFASAIIEVQPDQTVIDTGPYAFVRHPMYTATIIVIFATPVALGSLWGFGPALVLAGAIVWRLMHEDAHLARHLRGYEDYRRRVPARLVPLLW